MYFVSDDPRPRSIYGIPPAHDQPNHSTLHSSYFPWCDDRTDAGIHPHGRHLLLHVLGQEGLQSASLENPHSARIKQAFKDFRVFYPIVTYRYVSLVNLDLNIPLGRGCLHIIGTFSHASSTNPSTNTSPAPHKHGTDLV